MIERYSDAFINHLFSDTQKFQIHANIEIELIRALEKNPNIKYLQITSSDVVNIKNLEKTTKHETAAFVQYLSTLIANNKYLHYGLTSSDLLDTTLSVQLKGALNYTKINLDKASKQLKSLSNTDLKIMGRTHGQHAQIINLKSFFMNHLLEFERAYDDLNNLSKSLTGKLSGAVGNNNFITKELEESILEKFFLQREEFATQIIPRDKIARILNALALTACAIERLALNIRLYQQTEINELSESFNNNQVGSSAMPHKRNPIDSEKLCGLSRLVRSNAGAAYENIALWQQRDMSHSSVERIIIPDSFHLVAHMLNTLNNVLSKLVINEAAIKNNCNDIELSQKLHHQLSFLNYKNAYKKAQELALRAQNENKPLKELVKEQLGLSLE